MQNKHVLSAIVVGTILIAGATGAVAQEGACALTYTRTACAGQEAESYKKCDGKQSCTVNVQAASADACLEAAVNACSNDRFKITKSKKITATFNGKPVKPKSGELDVCLTYPKRDSEFNQCDKH